MKYDNSFDRHATTKTEKRRVEPEHLKVPDFVQTPPSRRVVNQQRQTQIQQNARRHKRRRKRNYILYYILMLFLIIVVGVSLSLTVFFNVENISVSGNNDIDSQSIINACGVTKGQNLFRVSTEKAAKNIGSKYLTIDSVVVNRKLPNTLLIKVKMAKTKAELKYSDKYFSLSHSNKIIGSDKTPLDKKAIKVVGADLNGIKLGHCITADNKNKLEVIDTVINVIEKNELSGNIKVVDISNEMSIKLYYDDMYEIKVGGIMNIDYKVQSAKTLIKEKLSTENEKGIIDVSVDNGMYYFRHEAKIVAP